MARASVGVTDAEVAEHDIVVIVRVPFLSTFSRKPRARGRFRDARFEGDVGSRRRVSVGAWANEGLGSVSGGGGVCVPGARVVVRNPRRILQPRPCRHPTILILANPFDAAREGWAYEN